MNSNPVEPKNEGSGGGSKTMVYVIWGVAAVVFAVLVGAAVFGGYGR
jgi:hypothetical protein